MVYSVCRCEVRGRVCGPLARGIRANRTLQQLNLSGTALGDAGGAAIAAALKCNKVLAYVNLAFCQLGKLAVDELSQVLMQLRQILAAVQIAKWQ